ncbi:hypothetical protein FAIPA1_20210 [Frankia sp. AiPs1]
MTVTDLSADVALVVIDLTHLAKVLHGGSPHRTMPEHSHDRAVQWLSAGAGVVGPVGRWGSSYQTVRRT